VLDRVIEGTNALSSVLSDGYVVMKVDYAEPGLANTIRRRWSERQVPAAVSTPDGLSVPHISGQERNTA